MSRIKSMEWAQNGILHDLFIIFDIFNWGGKMQKILNKNTANTYNMISRLKIMCGGTGETDTKKHYNVNI